MKKMIFSFCMMLALCAGAWKIDSGYQIVLPDQAWDGTVERALKAGAETLQHSLAQTNVNIPIVTLSQADPKRKKILIGFPDGKRYEHFSGSIRIADGNIHITGNDRHGFGQKGARNSFYAYYLGSIKALVVFMEDYLDTRFVAPGKAGAVAGTPRELPEKLDRKVVPRLIFGSGRYSELIYDYANNNFGRGSTHVYGGHSHYSAIPQKLYGKSHPEYFSLVDGKRTFDQHYHGHCLSNPAVAELVYAEMLRKLDAGAETVELAQTDGNKPCECDKCKALYGVSDSGEKMWIFHTRLAERLLKERPGKKVLIICYWPNNKPPATFKKFPANIMVEITIYTPKALASWKGYEIPQGTFFYIYNWGYYQREGFTPKNCAPDFLAAQVRAFTDFGIRGLYRCGFGELRGLEGAGYYVYGKLFDNPAADPKKLQQEYCLRMFGAAAPEMEAFYELLYSRQKFDFLPPGVDQWSHRLRDLRKVGELEIPLQLMVLRYPPEVLEKLEALLRSAEKKFSTPAAKFIAPYLNAEFEYLKCTAGIANSMELLRKNSDPAVGREMMEQVSRRNKLISSLPKLEFPLFNGAAPQLLRTGGRMYCELGFPYQLDGEKLLREEAIPCGRLLKAGGKEQPLIGPESHPVKVSAAIDGDDLLIRYRFPGVGPEKLGEDKLNCYIGDAEGKLLRFQAWLNPGKKVYVSERVKNSMENAGKPEVLKNLPNRGATLVLRGEKEDAVAELRIPFAMIGGRPEPGTRRFLNLSRLRYLPGDNRKQDGFYIWEYNPGRLNWRQDLDRTGTLEF